MKSMQDTRTTTSTIKEMNSAQIGWLAGIIEGEGSIYCDKKTTRIAVGMTDMDIVYRLQDITGVGNIYERPTPEANPHWKPQWTWVVSNYRDIMLILESVSIHLGARRLEQATKIVDKIAASCGKSLEGKNFCFRGHEKTDDNVYLPNRQCKRCVVLNALSRKFRTKLVVLS